MIFLGRKVRFEVLPKVSSALAQFIRPISTSESQTSTQKESGNEYHRDQKQKRQNQPPQPSKPPDHESAKVIPFEKATVEKKQKDKDEESEAPPVLATEPAAKTSEGQSATFSFLRLFSTLHEHRFQLMRWFGSHIYSAAGSNQKQKAKYRKGAMLDHRS